MPDHATEIATILAHQSDAQAIAALVREIQGLRGLYALHLTAYAAGAKPVRPDTMALHEPERVRESILIVLGQITDPMQLSLLRIGAQVIASLDRNAHRGAAA